MRVYIEHQESYSRSELLLRSFFGWLYIVIPHLFVLLFINIGLIIVQFLAFWIILFTGVFPKSMWEFCVNSMRWSLRVIARMMHLVDGYPAFGLDVRESKTSIEIAYPEKSSRGLLLLRVFFGFIYVLIPHAICISILGVIAQLIIILAWFIVLFTGKYPKGMHDIVVGYIRWQLKVNAYMMFLTEEYPPFSLSEKEEATPLDKGY